MNNSKRQKIFLSKGNIIEAENCFQNILNKYPKNIRALEGLKKLDKVLHLVKQILINV